MNPVDSSNNNHSVKFLKIPPNFGNNIYINKIKSQRQVNKYEKKTELLLKP